MISKTLLEILACPACDDRPAISVHGDDWLVCKQCDRYYPIKDGIPHMIAEEAVVGGPPETQGEPTAEGSGPQQA